MNFLTPLNLAYPIVFGIIFFGLAFLSLAPFSRSFLSGTQIKPKIFSFELGVFGIDVSTTKRAVGFGLAFVTAGISCFYYQATRDYGSLLPKKYNIVVSFNKEAIEKSLALYPIDVLDEKKVMRDSSIWSATRASYADQIIAPKLAAALKRDQKDVLSSRRFECTSGHGGTRVMIERRNGGLSRLQAYELEDSYGNLYFESKCDNLSPSIFQSSFKLNKHHDDNLVFATMGQVFLYPWEIYTKPRYRQYGVDDKTGNEIWGLELHVLTKLSFFPFPRIDNSIYLFEDKNSGNLVPLATANYIETQ